MAEDLSGKKVAFIASEGVEEVELTAPRKAVEDAGGTVELLSIEEGEIQAMNHIDKSATYAVDGLVADASPEDYDGVVLPGGVVNPDNLRADESVITFLQEFAKTGKPIAAICHGPWTLVEADLVRDRTLTSYPSIKTDIANAGGNWVDEEVVCDQALVTSRNPDDLPAFNAKLIEEIAEGAHEVADAGATAA
ncbi:MAG: type 1 glutamine amidotransferase domain-containing protein [Solirubrobacterales bacterium]